MRGLFGFAILIAVILTASGSALSQPTPPAATTPPSRIALVVYASEYQGLHLNLINPPRDAAMVAAGLKTAGFSQVQILGNPRRPQMVEALAKFRERARSADIAMVYFTGAGFQVDGEARVIPADAKLTTGSRQSAVDESIPVSRLVESVEEANRLALIVLDGGRENFNFSGSRGLVAPAPDSGKGLARAPSRVERVIMYSSASGEVAADGAADSAGSPFAVAFAKRIAEDGDIVRVFGRMAEDVRAATRDGQRPTIDITNPSGAPTCLVKCSSAAPVARAALEDLGKAECKGGWAETPGQETRYALVVANTAYHGEKLSALTAPNNDARNMTSALSATGFSVRTCYNLNRVELEKEIGNFTAALSGATKTWEKITGAKPAKPSAFFYFSGHGAATAEDGNFLIPVREDIATSAQLPLSAVQLAKISAALSGTGARVVFIVVDACRNVLNDTKGGAGGKGLRPEARRAGVLLAFATEPGKTAPDNSNFSRALAAQIKDKKPEEATLVFKRVGETVRAQDSEQRPWVEGGDYDGDYYFRKP